MGMNFQDVLRDVHDPGNHSLNVNANVNANSTVYIGTPTLYAVVNTAAAGQASVVLDAGTKQIGSVTVSNPISLSGNITLSDSKTYIGLTTATIGNNPVLGAGVNGIGFSTVNVANTVPVTFAGNVTLDPGSKTGIVGNITISDSKGYIGLVTVTQASSARTITGNVTLSDSKMYIGLTTTTLGSGLAGIGFATVAVSTPTLFAVVNTGAPGTTDVTSNSGVTVYQGGTWTVTQSSAARTITSGTLTAVTDITNPVALKGNLTLSDSKTGIGLVSVFGGSIGISGNVTLSDAKAYIGLTTTTLGAGLAGIGFATVAVSTPTLFAVVNTGAPGTTDVTSNSGVTVYQGGTWTVTQASSARTITGNVTLTDSKGFIGLATVNIGSSNATLFAVVNTAAAGQASVVLDNSISNIGFATVWIAANPNTYIGLVTIGGGLSNVAIVGNVTLSGTANVAVVGNLTLSDSKNFIGLTTVVQASAVRSLTGNITLSDSKTYIGLATVTSGAGDRFIGLTTSVTLNAGTLKTLSTLPIGFSASSVTTIAIPTSSNSIKLTQLILNSNATVGLALKSGATYLTGNASIRVNLNPGGGFVLIGAPDSPSWIGLPSGALVIEKADSGSTAHIAGHVTYFQE